MTQTEQAKAAKKGCHSRKKDVIPVLDTGIPKQEIVGSSPTMTSGTSPTMTSGTSSTMTSGTSLMWYTICTGTNSNQDKIIEFMVPKRSL